MAHPFKLPVNYRTSASAVTGEAITVEGGVALLAEAPAAPTTNAVVVTIEGNSRTRVTGAPAVGEFRVRTQAVIYADLQPHIEYPAHRRFT